MARHPYTCPLLRDRASLSLSLLLFSKSFSTSLRVAVVIFLVLVTHALAAEPAERQWSAPFPGHTAIPKDSALPFAIALASPTPCNRRKCKCPSPLRAVRSAQVLRNQ
jgi:hypothetical protein